MNLYPELAHRPSFRDGYAKVGFLAHGWYMRVHRSIEAVLMLGDAGFPEEAAPLRRSIIEHVLALRWLAAEGDKILDTILRAHALDAKNRADAVTAAAWTSVSVEEIERIIANIDPASRDRTGDHLLPFAHRLAQFGDQHTRPGYLAESAKSHPTYESAMSYVGIPSGDLLWHAREPVWPVPFCSTQVLEALLCVREVFEPQPWEPELEAVIERFKAVTDEVRKQDGLPPVDWATGTVKGQ